MGAAEAVAAATRAADNKAANKGNKPPQPAAAQTSTPAAEPQPTNLFDRLYPSASAVFVSDVQPAGDPYKDGTVSQTLARVTLATMIDGKTVSGLYFSGSRIVKKTGPKFPPKGRIELQLPSTGRSFHRPIIDAKESADVDRQLGEWAKNICRLWAEWRLKEKEAGRAQQVTASTPVKGFDLDDDALAALEIQ